MLTLFCWILFWTPICNHIEDTHAWTLHLALWSIQQWTTTTTNSINNRYEWTTNTSYIDVISYVNWIHATILYCGKTFVRISSFSPMLWLHCVRHDSKHYDCDWRSENCIVSDTDFVQRYETASAREKKTLNVGASCQSIISARMPQWIHFARAFRKTCTMFQAADNVLKNMGWVPNSHSIHFECVVRCETWFLLNVQCESAWCFILDLQPLPEMRIHLLRYKTLA